MRHDTKDMELSKYLYATYGEKPYTGLDVADPNAARVVKGEVKARSASRSSSMNGTIGS